jgi:hypothetical protein
MEQMDADGRVYFPADKNLRLRRKRFLDELEGESPVSGGCFNGKPIFLTGGFGPAGR